MSSSKFKTDGVWLALLGLLAVVYVLAVGRVSALPYPRAEDGARVAVPRWVQVIMVGGDRYLAANVGFFRALLVGGGRLSEGSYPILARVQADVALLNPAHEDNYYLATAILPWQGELKSTQLILSQAIASRHHDVLPPFFYAFNQWYFLHDIPGAVRHLQLAAERETDVGNRVALLGMVAGWSERGHDRHIAIVILRAMAEQSRHPQVREYLLQRVGRLVRLDELEQAVAQFRQRQGRPPRVLEELVGAGLIRQVPRDPLGKVFRIDSTGQVLIAPQ